MTNTAAEVHEQNRILQENSKIPLIIACNTENGGNGACSNGTMIGAQTKIGATGDAKYAKALGKMANTEAAAIGCNLSFAPVSDIYYNWHNPVVGLRTYGNLPLIEPLESRESKKIRDFVIVIDTSESTSGELVKAFLKETFGLLKTGESFFAKCNIAVMQCDDAVRDLTFLHSTDELDRFAACLTLTGGGGTDFRPAFAKIEQLRRDGTLRDLQGVLYFTDGKGTYPTRRPPYETAFLFLETGTPPPDTPPWAMRLVLSPEEFLPDPVPKTPEIDWQENEAEDLPEL